MSLSRTAATKNLALDAAYDRGTGMLLKAYSVTVPANADASLGAAVLLFTLTLSSTPFTAASAGEKTASPTTSDTAAAVTGTPSLFTLLTSGVNSVAQG